MSKPKIALMIDWYLPGTKAGGPVRSVYSLVSLLKPWFDFYIITTNTDLGENEPYQDVEPDTLFLKEDVHYYYFSNGRAGAATIMALLKQIRPDLIYLNSFWSFHFSISIVRLRKKGLIKTPVLLAPRGMLGKGALGLKSMKKRIFLALSRFCGWYRNITFHATQEQEKHDILDKFRSGRVIVAPNINSGSVVANKSTKEINQLNLFYLSRVAKVKNLHFALEILKGIPAGYQVNYDIFGNMEDMDYWNTCMEIIATLPGHIKVTYKGELQFNEVQSIISGYNCLLLPTLNENFGHSIVESLMCGCPVIISDQTPWNDLEEQDAGFAIGLQDRQKFTSALLSYLPLDQQAFSVKSQQAINYISRKIDLELITGQYKFLFNESIKN